MATLPIINARSPYIVSVNQAGQLGSMVKIYISNGALPTTPTGTVSKLIASPTNTLNTYNISPYIREYIKHNFVQPIYNIISQMNPLQWATVKIQRFRFNGTSYILIDSKTYYAVDGYGYYENGTNPALNDILLTKGIDYTYNYDLINPLSTNGAGMITLSNQEARHAKYTNLVTGSVYTEPLTVIRPFTNIYRVFPAYYAEGNKVEILDSTFNTIKEYTFRPVLECRYQPVIIDFINRFGAWQREFFYKASFNNMSTKSDVYNILPSVYPNYAIDEGQRREFNNNGTKTIKVNTDYVNENYSNVIQEILLSERILVDFLPAQLKTRDVGKLKKVNTKLINYTLEFEYTFDIINSVI